MHQVGGVTEHLPFGTFLACIQREVSMTRSLLCITSIFFTGLVTAKADTVSVGTQIQVRPDAEIRVDKWDRGRIYYGHVARDVTARNGVIAIPRGSNVELIIRQRGPNRLAIDIESVTVNGRRYVMDSSGPQFRTRDYENGAGLVGSIVGAVTGVTTDGNSIVVPRDSVLSFQTQAPLHIVDWPDPGYERDRCHYHRDPDWYR
jgi:hypothetical protein